MLTREERERAYLKKPKSILVMDCVYLSTCRDDLTKELREREKTIEALRREVNTLKMAAHGLQLVNSKLTESISAMRDVIMGAIR